MSIDSSNPQVISQKIINFGPPEQDKNKKGDPLWIQKQLKNEWNLMLSVSEYGKIVMRGSKDIGSIGNNRGEQASLNITLETSEKRAAPIMKVYSNRETEFIEVDDRLDRTTESFKKEDEYYKREWPASSVITPSEFFNETVPSFEQLLNDKKLDVYFEKIADETSKVQKPFNKSWKNTK